MNNKQQQIILKRIHCYLITLPLELTRLRNLKWCKWSFAGHRQPAFALAFEYSKTEELVSLSSGIHKKVRLSMVVPAYLEKAR